MNHKKWDVNITEHRINERVKEWGYTEADEPHGTIQLLGDYGWEPVGFQLVNNGTLHVMWKRPTDEPAEE